MPHHTVRQILYYDINCLMMLKDKDEMCLNKINVRHERAMLMMMMKFLHISQTAKCAAESWANCFHHYFKFSVGVRMMRVNAIRGGHF